MFGDCKLCGKLKNLKISHAIGNSAFRKIFRTNSGKAIAISAGDDAISYSSDSWAEHQLCEGCERLLNSRYETYALRVLRGQNGKLQKSDLGLIFSDLDQNKLIMYFLSIYWRAANSGHPSYRNVVILEKDKEFLRKAILNDISIPSGRFSVKISRVVDLAESGGFSPESIKQIIVSPFCRIYETYKIKNISICFMFEGFFIEIYLRPLKLKERFKPGVLMKSKNRIIVPYLNLFDIEEVVNLMVKGLGKYKDGNIRIKTDKSAL